MGQQEMNPTRSAPPSRKDEELSGIVRMIDSHRCLGKIFLDDGRESSAIRFPETYQDGDRIFATFKNNNPEEMILSFRVTNDEWYYGTVIVEPNVKGAGSILINWPALLGTVYFSVRDLPVIPSTRMWGTPMRFHLRKDCSGRLSVSDLGEAPDDMKHYARSPFCGRLVRNVQRWESGFVKKVVNRDTFWYGFIERPDNPENVFFTGTLFEMTYKRKAMSGDVVFFKSARREKGPAAQIFNSSGDDGNNSTWVMETHDFKGIRHRIRCPKSTFSNFLEPFPDRLYFVYSTDKDVAAETREVRIENVPEAIALIKNRGISEEVKLPAVDFLIKADLEHPEKFQAPLMKKRKIEMLKQAASVLLARGETEEALRHEVRLQCIEFQPERLREYRHLSSPLPLLGAAEASPHQEKEIPWEIIWTDLLPSPEEQGADAWRPIFESPSDDAPRTTSGGWFLDPDWIPGKALQSAEDPLYFDIELT